MNTKLSIVIATRNRANALKRTLEAIDQQELDEVGGELVVVDNGSTDHTLDVLKAYQRQAACKVHVLEEPRRGVSYARNAGIARASGEVIVFTDDDCYLQPGYLRTASTLFNDRTFQYCGGRILLYDPTDSTYGCNLKETFEIIPPGSFIAPGKFQGANMVMHRRVLDKIGCFDTVLGAGIPFRDVADLDLCARASRAGFAGAHVPDLVVYHHHGRKPGSAIRKVKDANGVSRGAYYMKFILMGDRQYLNNWVKRRVRFNALRQTLFMSRNTMLEVKGALMYLYLHARKQLQAQFKI